MRTGSLWWGPLVFSTLVGCQTVDRPPIEPVDYVDLERFMGDWYVVANIPTFLERDAHNAVESYELEGEGRIATTFSFRDGGFDGPRREFNPTGFVRDHPSNAVWGMQFIWPVKADYRIMYLDSEYTRTIIARNKRDYVWIMAREPQISDRELRALVDLIADEGYDRSRVRRVPQRWSGDSDARGTTP
jgi:apolipoprotein D and lipocalin family protein